MTESSNPSLPGEEAQRHVVRLDGCRPTPLGAYLKALGVLRLLSEQADPKARGWWERETFVLETAIDRQAICDFFLDEYEPTPILAPWNGGSGFYPKDNTDALEAILEGGAARLRILRRAIAQVGGLIRDEGLDERPEGDEKDRFLSLIRGEVHERLLPWLDAAIMLSSDGTKYPPLLGTGGNDGRLDFTNNFMGRLVDVMDADSGLPRAEAPAFLRSALFDLPVASLQKAAIGQFAPQAAGGPNASTGFSGGSLVNAWDFILMLEGAVLFAGTTARRLERWGEGRLAYPFTVRMTGAGSGGASLRDEGAARAETWVPLWEEPTTLQEVRAVLGEGRVVLGRSTARDGLDFARAVAKLGVDRGITSFQRYAYLMRAGRAYLATPLNRIRVKRNPAAALIDQLDEGGWLRRFRRFGRDRRDRGVPARLASIVRRLEDAIFELAKARDEAAPPVQKLLVTLGDAQRYLAASLEAMEACRPVPVLGWEWAKAANDGSLEFEVASALAGLHAKGRDRKDVLLPMAAHMAPLAPERRKQRAWDPQAQHRVVWGAGEVDQNLGRVMLRRLLEARELDLHDLPLESWTTAPLAATSAWLQGALSARRIGELLQGLSLARIPGSLQGSLKTAWPPTVAYGLLKPLFTPRVQLRETGWLPHEMTLPYPAQITRLLIADRVSAAIETTRRILRTRGLVPPSGPLLAPGIRGARLLAVLMVPLSDSDLDRLLRRVFAPGEERDADSAQITQED